MALVGLLLLAGCGGGGGESREPAPVGITTLTVFPSAAKISPAQTQQYTVVAKDSNNNIRNNVEVLWTVADLNIASIDQSGLLTALAVGTTSVRALTGSVSSQAAVVTIVSEPTGPGPVTRSLLPPWITYCEDDACQFLAALDATACPMGQDQCSPKRSTEIRPQVDGIHISNYTFPVNSEDGVQTHILSGSGRAVADYVFAFDANLIRLRSDVDITFGYYGSQPVWGGVTPINFESKKVTSSRLTTYYFHHASYATGEAPNLHAKALDIMRIEQDMTGVSSHDPITAFFIPSEMSGWYFGEGNFSYGNGTVTVNYGSPAYIAATGGITKAPMARFSHEHAHELFDEISHFFPDNFACLNEGIADATGFMSGFLPVEDFGPDGIKGLNFEDGCQEQTAIHDIGNCSLWHVKKAGHLTPSFIRGLFHPLHRFVFDSCVLDKETGDNLWVYYTESAGGVDMVAALDSAKIPHSATFAEAKKAIGIK